ncbi:hypothetical protein HK104_009410 [Borealophlyctis nickersoniae]|nr:hypothetical protein HK104_009410 [Borealophlyctis nickersoniae]
MDDVVGKPLQPDILTDAVKRALRGVEARRKRGGPECSVALSAEADAPQRVKDPVDCSSSSGGRVIGIGIEGMEDDASSSRIQVWQGGETGTLVKTLEKFLTVRRGSGPQPEHDSITSPHPQALHLVREAATLLSSSPTSWEGRPYLRIVLGSPDITANKDTPVQLWKPLQATLAEIYVQASRAAWEAGNPLLDVDVVLEGWCGHDPWVLEDLDTFMGYGEDLPYLAEINTRRAHLHLPHLKFIHIPSPSNTVPESSSLFDSLTVVPSTPTADPYDHVALGGTFDHLHHGHKILLTMAAWLAKKRLLCGVVDFDAERLQKKKHFSQMEPLEARLESVRRFLNLTRRADVFYEVVPIQDDLGPTRYDADLQAIVGSVETKKGCEFVNKVRQENGLRQLDMYIIGVIAKDRAEVGEKDMSLKISSTTIRAYLEENAGVSQ